MICYFLFAGYLNSTLNPLIYAMTNQGIMEIVIYPNDLAICPYDKDILLSQKG